MSKPNKNFDSETFPTSDSDSYTDLLLRKGTNIIELKDAYVTDRIMNEFQGDTSHWGKLYSDFGEHFFKLSNEEKIALIKRLFPDEL